MMMRSSALTLRGNASGRTISAIATVCSAREEGEEGNDDDSEAAADVELGKMSEGDSSSPTPTDCSRSDGGVGAVVNTRRSSLSVCEPSVAARKEKETRDMECAGGGKEHGRDKEQSSTPSPSSSFSSSSSSSSPSRGLAVLHLILWFFYSDGVGVIGNIAVLYANSEVDWVRRNK